MTRKTKTRRYSTNWINITEKAVKEECRWIEIDKKRKEKNKRKTSNFQKPEKKLSAQEKREIFQLKLFFSTLKEKIKLFPQNIDIRETTIRVALARVLNNQRNSASGLYVFKKRDILAIVKSWKEQDWDELNFHILQAIDSI